MLNYLLHFLFPRTCGHCHRDLVSQTQNPLCPTCFEQLQLIVPFLDSATISFAPQNLYCQRCGIPLPHGGAHCHACRGKRFFCDNIRSVFLFTPPLQSLIHRFKYEDRKSLAQPLGEWMGSAFKQYPELQDTEILIPVPLHAQREKKRGFNQSHLLAAIHSQNTGLPLSKILTRIKPTPPQVKLSKTQRIENVQEAFELHDTESIKHKKVLLIDDVCTTGATLEECARVLRRKGHAKKVYALTLARQI
ncbi:MAG: ComF family protein [Elusimicrobia bacterium]|nr:ComF family protein [Elusimicrobiota bacterium]